MSKDMTIPWKTSLACSRSKQSKIASTTIATLPGGVPIIGRWFELGGDICKTVAENSGGLDIECVVIKADDNS
jgi:hypothetical protein